MLAQFGLPKCETGLNVARSKKKNQKEIVGKKKIGKKKIGKNINELSDKMAKKGKKGKKLQFCSILVK